MIHFFILTNKKDYSSYFMILSRGQIFCLLSIIIASLHSLSAQGLIIDDYCANIPEKHYEYCYEWEQSLNKNKETPDPIRYYKLSKYSLRYNRLLSMAYIEKAMEVAQAYRMDSSFYVSLSFSAIPLINGGEYDNAVENLERSIDYFQRTDNIEELSYAYRSYGYLERSRSEYLKALEYFNQCMELQHQFMAIDEMGDVYNRIGITYNAIGDTASMIRYTKEYLDYLDAKNKETGWATIMKAKLARIYYSQDNIELAKPLMEEVITVYNRSKSPQNSYFRNVYKKQLFKEEGDYDQALMATDSAIYFAYQYNDDRTIGSAHAMKYYLLKSMGQRMSAEADLMKAIEVARNHTSTSLLVNYYHELSELESLKNNYKQALEYKQYSDSLYDIVYSDEMVNEVKNMEKKMLTRQKEKEIESLHQQNLLKEDNLRKERKIRWFMSGMLMLFGGLIFLTYKLFMNKSKAALELKKKNEAIAASLNTNKLLVQEIHHRVKNNLQVISSLLGLQSRFVTDEMASEAIKTGKLRVQSMSLLHQNLYKNEVDKKVFIRKYFVELCANLTDTFNGEDRGIPIQTDIEDIELDIDTVVPMGLITNELITNAYKHAFDNGQEGVISLKIFQNDADIVMRIADNGVGVPFTEIPKLPDSLGLRLIQSFTEKLNGRIQINNGIGTTFTIKFLKPREEGNLVRV